MKPFFVVFQLLFCSWKSEAMKSNAKLSVCFACIRRGKFARRRRSWQRKSLCECCCCRCRLELERSGKTIFSFALHFSSYIALSAYCCKLQTTVAVPRQIHIAWVAGYPLSERANSAWTDGVIIKLKFKSCALWALNPALKPTKGKK